MCFTLKPDSAPSHKEFAISLSIADNDPGYHPTSLKNPVNVFFIHDDITCKRKKFSIIPDVFKLADSDIERVSDLNGKSS